MPDRVQDKQVAILQLANNERREQALIADESRSRLPFGVKALYTTARTGSISSYSLNRESHPGGYPESRSV